MIDLVKLLQSKLNFSIFQFQFSKISLSFSYQVSGSESTRPAVSFVHFGFDAHLMSVIRKSEYAKPTPIQAQVWYQKASIKLKRCFILKKKYFWYLFLLKRKEKGKRYN